MRFKKAITLALLTVFVLAIFPVTMSALAATKVTEAQLSPADEAGNPVAVIGDNLIDNGSFEKSELGKWTTNMGNPIVNTMFAEGSKGLKIIAKGTGTIGEIKQTVDVKNGKTYYISSWHKPDKANGVEGNIVMTLNDSDGKLYDTKMEFDMNAKTDDEWKLFRVILQIPNEAKNPKVTISASSSNEKFPVYADDFRILEVSDTSNIKGLVKVTVSSGTVKVIVNNKATPAKMRYLGINGGGGSDFNNISKYVGDALWDFNRQFIGNGMPASRNNMSKVTDKQSYEDAIATVKANPMNNEFVNLEQDMIENTSHNKGYNSLDLFREAKRLGQELEIQQGPYNEIQATDYRGLFGEWISSYYMAYTMAKDFGVTKHAIMNEPDQYIKNWDNYLAVLATKVDAVRSAVEKVGLKAEIWGPTFAGGDVVKNVERSSKTIGPYTDVYCFNKYSLASSFKNAYGMWKKYIEQNNPADLDKPIANTEFNYILKNNDSDWMNRMMDAIKVAEIQQRCYVTGFYTTNYFLIAKTYASQHKIGWTSGLLQVDDTTKNFYKPIKTYYALRMTNRAFKYPSDIMESKAEGTSQGQEVTVTRGENSYFVFFRNDTKKDLGTFTVDLSSLGLTTGNAVVRELSDTKNDDVVGTYPILNGTISHRNIPSQSAILLVIPRNDKKPEEPVIHRAFEMETGNELWWLNKGDITSYNIMRKEEGGEYTTIKSDVSDSYFTDLSAEQGKKYYYKVQGVNGNGAGELSDEVGALVPVDVKDLLPAKTDFEDGSDVAWERNSGTWEMVVSKNNANSDTNYVTKPGEGKVSIATFGNVNNSTYNAISSKYYIKDAKNNAKWGLILKYTDENNYYLFEVDKLNKTLSIKKKVNGEMKTLGSKALMSIDNSVDINLDNKNLMLYASKMGKELYVSVYAKASDLKQNCMFSVKDAEPLTNGKVGFYAENDLEIGFDGIQVIPTLLDTFQKGKTYDWEENGGIWGIDGDNDKWYTQSDVSGNQWNISTTGDSNWTDYTYAVKTKVGTLSDATSKYAVYYRFKDANNHYRVELSKTDGASLIKRVNGFDSIISTALLSVEDGNTYSVLTKVDRNLHTVVINGKVMFDLMYFEPTLPYGKIGVGTYKGAVSFDEAVVNQQTFITTQKSNDATKVAGEFDDTDDHWAKDDIKALVNRGIVKGINETEFSPNASITRAEFTALIARVLKLKDVDFKGEIADIQVDEWYANIVQAAIDAKIMDEALLVEKQFKPTAPITREEMTSLIINAYKKAGGKVQEVTIDKYTDKDAISTWAMGYVKGASNLGIIKGITPDSFGPKENSTRAQASVMIKRLMEKMQFIGEDGAEFNPISKPIGNKAKISVKASEEEAPSTSASKAIDKNFSTRWSAQGTQWLQADLGSVKKITSFGLAIYNGKDRSQKFDVSYSTDGQSWTKIMGGQTSAKTAEYEYFDLGGVNGRYLRLNVKGTSGGNWNSITEFGVYVEGDGGGADIDDSTESTSNSTSQSKGNKLTIQNVTASATPEAANKAENVIDGKLTTKWAAEGAQWLQADLGSTKKLSTFGFSVFKGNERKQNFEISYSTDGQNWTKVTGGQTSGKTTDMEYYDLGGVSGRYVKLSCDGTTASKWNSINEIEIYEGEGGGGNAKESTDSSTQSSTKGNKVTVAKVSASESPEPENKPENAIDGKLDTRWSSEGKQWLIAELSSEKKLTSVGLAFWKGNERAQKLDIELSTDGNNWVKVFSGQSSGKSTTMQYWQFNATSAKFVRISCDGNTASGWNSISELVALAE